MSRFELETRFASLEKLIQKAATKGLDEEHASYLCKLGCVQVCGNLERCIEIIICNRLSNAPKQFSSFLKTYFKRGTNYDCDNIIALLHRLDTDWGHKFKNNIKDSDKESISSCYSVRNSIAHGGGQSLGIKSLQQYYNASLNIVAEIEQAVR
ncbi:hypothetical protein FHS77_001207 [Paenochrobactrum gallinarii]|uniref:RiboL-PSP-HEPN domain-containing protein n=1 Tax=Paenochrobactrum gallinarii TaxID=643673 RepID=A0A841LTS5_9HYPH|nr:HEPN domain-containing protein [Paenochrobactrum gallinarii]MBB6260666.1 hypothetical protein [Paenochrobactrum gallinarii]